ENPLFGNKNPNPINNKIIKIDIRNNIGCFLILKNVISIFITPEYKANNNGTIYTNHKYSKFPVANPIHQWIINALIEVNITSRSIILNGFLILANTKTNIYNPHP